MNLLSAEKLTKTYGVKSLFSELSFGIAEGDKIGLIGVNGAGKSTLLKILAGIEHADSGQVVYANNARVGYLSQNPFFNPESTVLETAIEGNSPLMELVREYETVLVQAEKEAANTEIQQKLLRLGERMDQADAWRLESEAKTILTKLGIADFTAKIGMLSGGQRKRVALAAALINPVDLLILDEPTNQIDNQTVDWLEGYLKERQGALLMVTHDRYFLDRVVDRIFELNGGKLFSYTGNYSLFLEKKAEREELEQSIAAKRKNLYRQELAWIRRGAKARSTKQQARIDRFEKLQSEMAEQVNNDTIEITAGSTRLGKKIVALRNLSKQFDGKPIIADFNYAFSRKDRVGIIGPNGIGKSTLLNLIVGNLEPDQGEVEVGPTVKFGFFTQEHFEMDEKLRVIDYIKEVAEFLPTDDGGTISAGQMLERFLFPPELQYTPITKLSGGEKRRLYLLRVLMGAPNVLLLDEPTNDLDIQTLTVLEDYLDGFFPGVVITVSHDRYFLDRVVEKILAFGAKGTIQHFVGNYSDYLDFLRNQPESIEPIVSKKNGTESDSQNTPPKRPPLKLSYKEQREFDEIEDVIAGVEAELEENQREITQAGNDYLKLQELTTIRDGLAKRLEQLIERWAYLNERVEEIMKNKM